MDFFPYYCKDLFHKFLKIIAREKVKASPLPECLGKNPTQKQIEVYAIQLAADCGIDLNGWDLNPSPGLREVAKMFLNALIGEL